MAGSVSLIRILPEFFARIFLAVVFFNFGCNSASDGVTAVFLNPDGSKSPVIQTEVVFTPDTRNRGMMYRQEMGEESGMLFVFPDSAERSFWMKNTYVELDIIFLNDRFEVVSISERAVPLTHSPRRSNGASKYVLEVMGGKAGRWGVSVGSRLEVAGSLPEGR